MDNNMRIIFTTDGIEVVRVIKKYIINNEVKYYVEKYCDTDTQQNNLFIR